MRPPRIQPRNGLPGSSLRPADGTRAPTLIPRMRCAPPSRASNPPARIPRPSGQSRRDRCRVVSSIQPKDPLILNARLSRRSPAKSPLTPSRKLSRDQAKAAADWTTVRFAALATQRKDGGRSPSLPTSLCDRCPAGSPRPAFFRKNFTAALAAGVYFPLPRVGRRSCILFRKSVYPTT
jgi:hypothetical protein